MNRKLLSLPFIFWSAMFVIVPLCMVFYYGLTDKSGAFTFDNILAIATAEHSKALWEALKLSVISTVICLLLAYPLAMILCNMNVNQNSFLVLIFILPMWMNFLLRTYAWMSLLEHNGIINRFLGLLGVGPFNMINTSGEVVLGMVYNYLPYMVLPLYTIMVKIDNSVIEAAQDLGANVYHVVAKVLVPLSMPGITTGITMVFGSNLLIGDLIELQFLGNSYNYNLGSAMSLVLMVIVLLCMSFTTADTEEMEAMV